MKFSREWVIPNPDTLQLEPVHRLIGAYLQPNMESVDPFARNCTIAKWRNDLNPDTKAEYHMDALDFLRMVQSKVAADIVIFDPPYSRQQVKEVYNGIGRHYGLSDTQYHTTNWRDERDVINQLLKVGGIVISFGWNSGGMGLSRLYEIIEIKLLCHGGAHNDTIIVVERKIAHQMDLFGAPRNIETCETSANNQRDATPAAMSECVL